MRLHSLELQAFGPFADRQTIDFDRVSRGGIFLLEGPTGVGKSTILDAITFALYGPDRESLAPDRLRSHFAEPGVETQVVLELSAGGARWRVRRSPEQARPKKRGAGVTTQQASVVVERREGDTFRVVATKVEEASAQIQRALGLDRAQFSRVVLLPQGEFSRFLRSGDDDRRVLLTRLFGARLYDRITEELDRTRVDASRDLGKVREELRDRLSAACTAGALGDQRFAELANADAGMRRALLDEHGRELEARAEATRAEATRASAAASQAQRRADAAQELSTRMRRKLEAIDALSTHEATQPEHDARVARLDAGRRAEPLRPLLRALEGAEERAGAAQARLPSRGAGAQPAPDASSRDTHTERSRSLERDAAELEALAQEESRLPGERAALERLAGTEAASAAAARRATERREQLPARVLAAEAAREDLAGHAREVEPRRAALGRARDREQAASQLAALEAREARLISDRDGARDARRAAVDRHQELVELRLTGMAAELASELARGVPCPVCGSPEHPAPARASARRATVADLEAAVTTRRSAEQREARLGEELQAVSAERAACAARAEPRSAGEAGTEALERELAAAVDAARRLPEADATLRALREEAARVHEDEREAATRLADATTRRATAQESLTEREAKLAAAAAGHASVAARQRALREAAREEQALAAAIGEALDANAELARALAAAEADRSARGFASIAEGRAAFLPQDEHAELEATVDTWRSERARCEGLARAADLVALDPADAARITEEASGAIAAAEAAAAARGAAEGAALEAESRAQEFAKQRQEVERAERALEAARAQAEPLEQLAALAKGTPSERTGTAGARKMNLTTYVLRQAFENVVVAANQRLAAMSSGRYALTRVDEADRKADRVGLTLELLDHFTGEHRSTSSLSGGETFYTSLALALGLVDVVRAEAGGVELGTLFVDEGFGTLDPATLDQVMSVLDTLRDCGRVVGIVSHVAELKERVPERLEVRHRLDRSSEVRVVA